MPQFTTSDGLSLHYTDRAPLSDTADPLPLLCLPGLTRSGADFDHLAPHLPQVRLLTLDARGRGQSNHDPDWQNYTLPVECRDTLELLDHLGLDRVAILGTSRGGLVAMGLAATARDRLRGVALNDVGPVVERAGLDAVMTYLGRPPAARSLAEAATAMQAALPMFENVPPARWLEEAAKQFRETEDGLALRYDPALRRATEAAMAAPPPDLWPFFDALAGLPLACIRGAASTLLTADTLRAMQDRRPDMIAATVPGRGHVPFLDEPQAVAALRDWTGKMT